MNHDHNHDHNHGTGSASCPMIMTFHAGHCERILWNGWMASTVTEFVFSALAIFVIAFVYEALKFIREYYLRQSLRKEAERVAMELQAKTPSGCGNLTINTVSDGPCSNLAPINDAHGKSYGERILASAHLVQTLLNTVQVIISYLLMLIFMTFNYWLCLAVVLGLGVGYFFFGWIRLDVYETECCQ